MRFPLIILIHSFAGLQAARGSPLTSASATILSLSSSVPGAPTISAAPSLNTNISANFTSQYSLLINGSTKATNISGPVTILKTIELIPQPVPSDPSAEASDFLKSAGNLVPEAPISAINAQKATLPTTSSSAKPRSSPEPSISSYPQVPDRQPVHHSVKSPILQPIIVGGITYAPEHSHLTHSNAIPWQENPWASQSNTEAVEWREYYPSHRSEPYGLSYQSLKSGQGLVGLPPVVVGGLTYRPVGKEFEVGSQTPTLVSVAGSATKTAETATDSFEEGGTFRSPAQPGSLGANSQYPGVSSPVSRQPRSASSSPTSSLLVVGSHILTAHSGSSGFILGSSTLLPGSPAITVNSNAYTLNPSGTLTIGKTTFILATSDPSTSEAATNTSAALAPTSSPAISGLSFVPASPSTFIIEGQTFTAYPSGLAIGGTEVFQGSSAITLSGTAISLGSSDIVIGTSTIPFASVTGLGAALSSGLSTLAITSTTGTGPTPTSTSGNSSHQSAAGQLQTAGSQLMAWVVVIALTVAAV